MTVHKDSYDAGYHEGYLKGMEWRTATWRNLLERIEADEGEIIEDIPMEEGIMSWLNRTFERLSAYILKVEHERDELKVRVSSVEEMTVAALDMSQKLAAMTAENKSLHDKLDNGTYHGEDCRCFKCEEIERIRRMNKL